MTGRPRTGMERRAGRVTPRERRGSSRAHLESPRPLRGSPTDDRERSRYAREASRDRRRASPGGRGTGAFALALALLAATAGCGDRAPDEAARASGGSGAGAGSVAETPARSGEAGADPATPASEAAPAAADTGLATLLSDLLPLVERSSGLEALRPPRLARADRERLRAYLQEQLREQLPVERARKLTAVYARFGLVPDTLDLQGLLAGLYQEQVVGYYDPAADTLFVLADVPPEQLETVLAHELVHALQDQHVDLDSLVGAVEGANDRGTAVQAAVEGHATLAMLEIQLSRMTGTEADVAQLPDLGAQLQGLDLSQLGEGAGLPELRDAPRVIREALIFPYVGGLGFVQALWKAREGRPAPFGRWLPVSTEQVLHPERLLPPRRDEPTDIAFGAEPPEGWTLVYEDGLGELETRLFLEEHLGDDEAARAGAAGWDGDRSRLLRGPPGEVLVWVSVWDSDAEADAFADAARTAWGRRYAGDADRRVRVERAALGGRPSVRVLDLPSGFEPPAGWGAAEARLGEG